MTNRIDIRKFRDRGPGRKVFWAVLAVALVVVLIGAARGSARGRDGDREAGHGHGELSAERIEEFLAADSWWLASAGISDEQRQRLAVALEASMAEFEAMQVERAELEAGLTDALAGEEVDAEQLDRLRTQASELTTRAVGQGFDVMVELAEVLTPEQRLELIEHWEKRR